MASTKDRVREYALKYNYKLGLRCADCGNPRANTSAHYCGACVRNHRDNNGGAHHRVVWKCDTTKWFLDDFGNKARLHGDLPAACDGGLNEMG
jgi:hypothetical protein